MSARSLTVLWRLPSPVSAAVGVARTKFVYFVVRSDLPPTIRGAEPRGR